MFCITPEDFANATTGHFGFVFEETELGQGNHMIIVTPSFLKSSAGVFKFLQFEERSRVV